MEDFYKFLKALPLSESIDALKEKPLHEGKQIADFFFLNRKIICEVKSLNKDTNDKIEQIIDSLRDREDFPIFYGSGASRRFCNICPMARRFIRGLPI